MAEGMMNGEEERQSGSSACGSLEGSTIWPFEEEEEEEDVEDGSMEVQRVGSRECLAIDFMDAPVVGGGRSHAVAHDRRWIENEHLLLASVDADAGDWPARYSLDSQENQPVTLSMESISLNAFSVQQQQQQQQQQQRASGQEPQRAARVAIKWRRWTAEEDEILQSNAPSPLNSSGSWQRVTALLPNRSESSARRRWSFLLHQKAAVSAAAQSQAPHLHGLEFSAALASFSSPSDAVARQRSWSTPSDALSESTSSVLQFGPGSLLGSSTPRLADYIAAGCPQTAGLMPIPFRDVLPSTEAVKPRRTVSPHSRESTPPPVSGSPVAAAAPERRKEGGGEGPESAQRKVGEQIRQKKRCKSDGSFASISSSSATFLEMPLPSIANLFRDSRSVFPIGLAASPRGPLPAGLQLNLPESIPSTPQPPPPTPASPAKETPSYWKALVRDDQAARFASLPVEGVPVAEAENSLQRDGGVAEQGRAASYVIDSNQLERSALVPPSKPISPPPPLLPPLPPLPLHHLPAPAHPQLPLAQPMAFPPPVPAELQSAGILHGGDRKEEREGSHRQGAAPATASFAPPPLISWPPSQQSPVAPMVVMMPMMFLPEPSSEQQIPFINLMPLGAIPAAPFPVSTPTATVGTEPSMQSYARPPPGFHFVDPTKRSDSPTPTLRYGPYFIRPQARKTRP